MFLGALARAHPPVVHNADFLDVENKKISQRYLRLLLGELFPHTGMTLAHM
jgi:hypothetical protein